MNCIFTVTPRQVKWQVTSEKLAHSLAPSTITLSYRPVRVAAAASTLLQLLSSSHSSYWQCSYLLLLMTDIVCDDLLFVLGLALTMVKCLSLTSPEKVVYKFWHIYIYIYIYTTCITLNHFIGKFVFTKNILYM